MTGTKVHTFPLVGSLSPDYRLPFQYLGPGSFAGKQFTLALLFTWIESQLNTPMNEPVLATEDYTLAVPAGKWALCSALETDVNQTINIGETDGGSEYGSIDAVTGSVHRVTLFVYGGSSGASVYFTGIGEAVTITTLII